MYMSIEHLYTLFLKASGISTDSRKIESGCIYFALRGEHFDGNQFAVQALEKGALAAVVDDQNLSDDPRLILVEDVLLTLQKLARFHRDQFKNPVLAITGSNGKTTTKELLASILSLQFKTHVTSGNLNNHIGVPLTLLSLNLKADIAIIEMGANHQGEIQLLCKIADPDFGMITNVGNAHLEGFGSFEGVKTAKGELYQYVTAKRGLLFINKNEEDLDSMIPDNAKVISYGTGHGVIYNIDLLESHPQIKYSFKSEKDQFIASSILSGLHNFQNIKSAIAISLYFGLSPENIIAGVSSYVPKNNRSQQVKTLYNSVFLDAYNANPASVIASFNAFMLHAPDKPIIILGDMLELGVHSIVEHQRIYDHVSNMSLGSLILVGEEFEKIKTSNVLHFRDVRLLINYLKASPIKAKEIFLKASRGIKLELVLEVL